jgi:hypothetical protein
MTEGRPSTKVAQRLGEAIAEPTQGLSRHDTMRDHVMALLRYGRNGEPGVELALITLYRAFTETVGPDRVGGEPEAMAEFERMCSNARVVALQICQSCPALQPCRQWFDSLPAPQRPRGVIAGRLVTKRSAHTPW